ncbi:MAG TPA: Fe-S cluster assembly protein SufD [Cyclobacteriaceae bacterium]|nr:Fe-S cluster assembly protein SufD [Cyclobacteriaceae bacterium]
MNITTDKRDFVAEMIAAGAAKRAPGLSEISLPTNKTEEYRFTPITRVLEKAFPKWPSPAVQGSITDIKDHLIPGLDSDVAVILNGYYSELLSKLSGGYTVSSLAKSNPEPISSSDPFGAINAALWNDGISVTAKKPSDRPLLVININDGSQPQAIHSRLVVTVADHASVSIIQKTVTIGTQPVFQTLTEEVRVGENARLEFCKIQNTSNVIEVCNTSISQANSSHVNTFTLTLEGKLIRNNLSISIEGERCESHFHGLSLLKGDTVGDHHTVVDHRKPNSFSNELYKGVMDDRSKGIFNGKIFVRPHAQKTNAFQSNRNILLTDQSTINTKPQLEIWADDVKCSHGCTTGQLDDEALFYLQSRGIGKEDARAMLLYAFAMQTTELITNSSLKAHVDSLISKRLYEGQ